MWRSSRSILSSAQITIEMASQQQPLLRIEGLSKRFEIRGSGGIFAPKKAGNAIYNVSFGVRAGETFGIVGESGSGKSTLLLCVARIMIPEEGRITFKDDILVENGKAFNVANGMIQMVFQDPNSSLNPTLTVRQIVAEPLEPLKVSGAEAEEKVNSSL